MNYTVDLMSTVADILDEARLDDTCNGDYANWADLECVEASALYTNQGWTLCKVVIEGADPSAVNLQNYVEDRLEEYGFSAEVSTRW